MKANISDRKLAGANPPVHKQQIDNPGIDAFFSGPEELYWAVNEQVLQQIVDSGIKMDYSSNGLKSRDTQNEIAAIGELANGRNQTEVANFFRAVFHLE